MSSTDILNKIKKYESNGIYYLANDNIVDQCEFVYDRNIKGEALVPKDNSNNISETTFSGVFEIDTRNFFMTSDGKWNSNNLLSTCLDQVKPSCRLVTPIRDDDFSSFTNDFQKIVANIRAIGKLGNPRNSRDLHSIIADEPN